MRPEEYAALGYDLVPVKGKEPLCRWRDKSVPTWLTEKLIEKYSGQIAFHCGRSGITVLDCDDTAAITFAEKNFPSSPMRARSTRGEHHYYQGITDKRLRFLGQLLDIISGNNLITVREWITPVIPVEDLPQFPALEKEVTLPSIPLVSKEASSVRKYIMNIFAIQGQYGSNATYRAACKLADSGLTEEQVFQELLLWNLSNASPPWSEIELRHKARSATSRRK